jgi:membrane fusion protein, multidrug efflux system
MNTKSRAPITTINAVATMFLILGITQASRAQGPPPTLVKTAPIVSMSFHDQVTLIGRTEAKSQSSIVSAVSGGVESINANEGEYVERGVTLVTIDSRRIRLSYLAKKAEAAEEKAQSELAEKNLKRAQELFSKNIVAENRLDTEKASSVVAVQRYERLNAEAKRLKIDLDNCTIDAPYAGYTVRRLVDIGEWVSPGTPVFEMVDLSSVKVTVDLPERYFGQVAVGSAVTISVSGSGAPNESGAPLIGLVTGVAPSALEDTHTFPVYVTISDHDNRLGAGMLVRATLSLKRQFTSLAVSKDAIVRQGASTMIYTIADGKAAPIPVQIGSTSGSMVSVTGPGLQEGTPIVVLGNERIYPGATVRTAEGEAGKEESEPGADQKPDNVTATDADTEQATDNNRTDG